MPAEPQERARSTRSRHRSLVTWRAKAATSCIFTPLPSLPAAFWVAQTRQPGTDALAAAFGAAHRDYGMLDGVEFAKRRNSRRTGNPEAWPHLSHTAS